MHIPLVALLLIAPPVVFGGQGDTVTARIVNGDTLVVEDSSYEPWCFGSFVGQWEDTVFFGIVNNTTSHTANDRYATGFENLRVMLGVDPDSLFMLPTEELRDESGHYMWGVVEYGSRARQVIEADFCKQLLARGSLRFPIYETPTRVTFLGNKILSFKNYKMPLGKSQ